jgi:hypothetical protein
MSWKKLLESISESLNDPLRLRNAYLIAEHRLLRRQIDGRVQLTDGERQELAAIGAKLGKKTLEEIATVASPETSLAWHRRFADHTVASPPPWQSVGRPCIDKEIEVLVVRMACENRSWGYDRIQGAVKHLGDRISDQTVGNILKAPWHSTHSRAYKDNDLEGVHSYPHGRPRGDRLLHSFRVELVSSGDL